MQESDLLLETHVEDFLVINFRVLLMFYTLPLYYNSIVYIAPPLPQYADVRVLLILVGVVQ